MKSVRPFGFALVLFSLGSLGCAGTDDDVMSWDEFRDQAHHEADTGVYVVNGDEAYQDESELAAAYWRYRDNMEQLEYGIGSSEQPLAVYYLNGKDVKWSASAAANITFCVSSASFGSHYAAVVSAMDSAASAWEGTARVNFVHSTADDADCNRNNRGVVFDVHMVTGQPYLARSFFPNSSRSSRELLIDSSSFGNIKPWSLAGILRHELGHTLGFRHEHTRPDAGTCFEDNKWRALTAYDSSSVMHYPQCNGTNNGDLVLTTLDKNGARALYP